MSRYTHIGVIRWIHHGCDKLYGTIVVDGAMSAEQLAELRSYLDDGRGFVPARLKDIELEANTSGKWHEMRVDDARVLDDDKVCGWEDIEPEYVAMDEFLTAMRAASERGWKSNKQLKAERRAALKGEALEVLAAYGALTYDSSNEDPNASFTASAVRLAEKVAGMTDREFRAARSGVVGSG